MKFFAWISKTEDHRANLVWRQPCTFHICKNHGSEGPRALLNLASRKHSGNYCSEAFQAGKLKFLLFPILDYNTRCKWNISRTLVAPLSIRVRNSKHHVHDMHVRLLPLLHASLSQLRLHSIQILCIAPKVFFNTAISEPSSHLFPEILHPFKMILRSRNVQFQAAATCSDRHRGRRCNPPSSSLLALDAPDAHYAHLISLVKFN